MLVAGCDTLHAADSRLAALLDRNGVPPLRIRPEGFATLVHLILQQQVSRASAQAVFDGLLAATGNDITPSALRAVPEADLRAAGWSRQKIGYARSLADAVDSGEFDLTRLAELPDEAAIAELERQRGIGPWTAAVYVLTALGRPDVWAPGDRALLVSLGRMLGRADVPTDAEATAVAEAWRPWRAVAARILWHDYGAGGVR